MIYALVALAITQPITVGIVVYLLTSYLNERDSRDERERGMLAQRIQAPETAIAQHVALEEAPMLKAVHFEDDADFQAAREGMA